MRFNLKRAVDNLSKKDLKFFQPLYEAITNSLEANASEIIVDLFTETLMFKDILPHVIGFSVTDNGDGFTRGNLDSFLELWSDRKLKFGCKGSGRFTWLSVFNDITIESEVSSENKIVTIPFNLHFEDKNIAIAEKKILTNKTVVKFTDVTDRYYDPRLKLDNRALADVDEIKLSIEQNLLIRLFLIKNAGKNFSIKIKYNGVEREINNTTIPDLSKSSFQIYSSITKKDYDFELYYHFNDNGKNSKKIYYCANDRIVKEEDDDSLNFSCSLPNKISFNMLLCSPYLDEMVNDARDEFPEMSNKKQANTACPLLFKDIKPELLKQMHLILLDKFPELEVLNKEQEAKAIAASPYLAKYIRENDDIVKSEKALTIKAIEKFNKEKISVKNRFEKLLKEKSIDPKTFNHAVAELSEVAVAELGEYVLYRNSIIKALQDAITNSEKKKIICIIYLSPKVQSSTILMIILIIA